MKRNSEKPESLLEELYSRYVHRNFFNILKYILEESVEVEFTHRKSGRVFVLKLKSEQ